MKLLKFSTTFLVFQLVLCHMVFAQDANSILKKLHDYHSDMMDNIEDMEIVMRPDGALGGFDRMTMYYKKEMVDGKPSFSTHAKVEGGMGEQIAGTTNSMMQGLDMFAMGAKMYENLKDVAKYEGVEEVDGAKTDVLYVANMTSMMEDVYGKMQENAGVQGDVDMQVTDVRMYIDKKKPVVRKISMNTQVNHDGEQKTIQSTIVMGDYRQVGPVYQPFLTKTIIENPMSPEQRSEMEKQMEQMEEMLKNLPEDQQGPIKQMLEAFGGDQIEISMIVEDLKINEGVPGEYFN